MKRVLIFFFVPGIVFSLGSCATSKPHVFASGILPRTLAPSALEQALAEADRTSSTGLKTTEDRQAYNAATEKVVALWMGLSDEKSRHSIAPVGATYNIQAAWPKDVLYDELIPAHTIKSKKFDRRVTREGVGVPLVAHWNYSAERKKSAPFMSDAGYFASVTATVAFRADSGGRRRASLVLHDSHATESVTLAGQRHALAADLSAYGEFLLAHKDIQMAGIKALLRSSNYMSKLGLIAFGRPSTDRIPLVFVHGLMSRPATWQNVINELGADPLLLRHFQIYVFRYPSGVPIVYSAAKLRESLALLHSTLQRQGNSTLHNHMVLIGHSMGGLVSKGQIQDSGDDLWEKLLGGSPDKLGLTRAEYNALRSYMEFDPNPSVSRVIFAATPHRGSHMADSTLAHIGRRLVSLPGQTFGSTFEILEKIASQDPGLSKLFAKGMPTSVDNLSPDSPYVRVVTKLPFRHGVQLHSIIGNKDGRPLTDPECSDGIVPYSSAHIDGVQSELVVRSDHGVHEKPEALEEMRRILRLHLKKLNLN